MARWEYLTVDFNSFHFVREHGRLESYTFVSYINPANIGLPEDRTVQAMTTVLDQLGDVGWELVSVVPIMREQDSSSGAFKPGYPLAVVKAILKRQVQVT